MLDHAVTRQGADSRIEWRQADALALPFEDASFDVVCCQFGAMFFPDRVAGYAEARRVLRPGGRFVFNVWDRIEENAFADDVTNAVATVFPHDPPRFLARTPHGYHDVALIREEVSRAGFTDIAIETREKASRASSARDSPLPIARERRCATKSRRATPACFSSLRTARRKRSPAAVAKAR